MLMPFDRVYVGTVRTVSGDQMPWIVDLDTESGLQQFVCFRAWVASWLKDCTQGRPVRAYWRGTRSGDRQIVRAEAV